MAEYDKVQEFNRFGPIVRDEDLEDPLNIPSASEEAVAESAGAGEAEVPADDSDEADEVIADETETVDADADGHDDATGEFVPGNQEAAADTDTPEEETPPTE